MIANSYLDSGFYNGGPQTADPHAVAYRFGNLQLNPSASAAYQSRSNSLVHNDSSHNYVDSKLYDHHQGNSHGHLSVMKSEFVPKEQTNGSSFKSPELPSQASSIASWNSSSSVRPSPPAVWNSSLRASPSSTSLATGPTTSDTVRFVHSVYSRSMSDMYSSCCQSCPPNNPISPYHQPEPAQNPFTAGKNHVKEYRIDLDEGNNFLLV